MEKNYESGNHLIKVLRKMMLVMKLTTFLLLIFALQISASVYSQKTKLSIDMQGTSIKDVLQAIESQTEYRFIYENEKINLDSKVDIQVDQESVENILRKLFSDRGIQYSITESNLILINPGKGLPEKSMGQQSKSISGKVTNYSGEPVPGATIAVKGTTNGTITDFEGNYSLPNVPEGATLIFSFVGMKSQEIQIAGKTIINVTLLEETIGIDEIVAIGYGTKQKRDLTGSITSVSGENLTETKAESFAQALQGRAAGVYVKSNSGLPGGGVSVRIRGIGGINNSEPLYIIDGIQISGSATDTFNPLANFNPNDIESVEVLKDVSSSAIYGARAANGVVLITTKRGKDSTPEISYTASFGVQNLTNPNNFEVLNGREYAEWVNKLETLDGKSAIFGGTNTSVYPAKYFPAPAQIGKGTNWLDLISRSNSPVHEHQLSINGGNEKHKYYLSASYYDQDGIIKSTSFKRYSIRLNTDNTLNKWLKVGNSFSVSHSKQMGIDVNRTMGGSVIAASLYTPPTINATNEDGSTAGPITAFYKPERTPYSVLTNDYNEDRRTDLMGNIYADIQLFDGLSFRSNISATMNFTSDEDFTPLYQEGITQSSVTQNIYTTTSGSEWLWNNVFTYDKMFGKHHLTALGGMEATESKSNRFNGNSAFNENKIRVVRSLGATTSSFALTMTSASLISYFGNISYNFDQKYYLEGNIRRDGSSQFGLNSRWGTFPSFSVAWRISKENFFSFSWLDDLKIRASYGEVGNNKVGNFAYIAPLQTVRYSMSGNDNQYNTGTVIGSLANPDLKWETSKQKNIGMDATLFNNKLTLAVDYFQTDVEDMLLGLLVPAFTGISASNAEIIQGNVITNVGSLKNSGFEVEMAYNGKAGNFTYGVNANLTTYQNELTNIGNNEQVWGQAYKGQYISRSVVGGSLGEFYGYVVDGIFQNQAEVDAANALDNNSATSYQNAGTAPGDYKYKDLNNDHVITADDRTTIGSSMPDFTYGFGFNVGYKKFELSALFNGSQGNDLFFASRIDLESSTERNSNKSRVVLNSWDGAGSSNTVARIVSSDPNQNSRISSKYVEDGSYLRLRNVKLSYKIPTLVTEKIGISRAQVYISANNLFTLTKYTGFDPEVGNLDGSNLNAGIDTDVYPQASSIHIGASITF